MILELKNRYKRNVYYYDDRAGEFKNNLLELKPQKGKKLGYDQLPSPVVDNVFKDMFACEEGKTFACMLIASFLEVDLEKMCEGMVLYRNEIEKIWVDGNAVRLDFLGLYDGAFFSIEMNNSNDLERNADYAHRLYSIFAKEGMKKKEIKYSSVFQLNINNFTLRGIDEPINVSMTLDEKNRMRTSIIFVDVYLPHLMSKYEKERLSKLNEEERMILGMFTPSEKEVIKITGGDENMMKFIERLKRFKCNPKKMEKYYVELDARRAGMDVGMELGREEGLERGRAEGEVIGLEKGRIEGLEKGLEETAKSMLEDGVAPEVVQKYTKLSIDKIMTLL